jgi:hypothetical protein
MTYIAPSFKYFQIFPEFIGGPLESDGLPSGLHWGTIGCPVPPDWGSVWTIGGPFARCWTPSSNTGMKNLVVESAGYDKAYGIYFEDVSRWAVKNPCPVLHSLGDLLK